MIKKSSVALLCTVAMIQGVSAQNLLTDKQVYPLGEAKTWTSSNDATYTFVTADLAKLVAVPANTSNIYLFPEAGGGWATDANKETGIQGFYIDMETTQEISIITTTWEGAAANAYDIYLTDTEPTLDILNTTPTYSDSGLGQYTQNTAQLPAGSTGRYLVFQPTDATNWGWGVKIRSIAAMAPAEDVLTSFNVMPGFVILNQATALTMTFTNQNGLDIDPSKVNVTVSDNATLTGTELIISSGTKAVLTATLKKVSLTANVFVATPPAIPESESIMTPIYTNTVTEYNDKAGFMVGYNGGAKDNGEIVFPDGEVARSFADTRCIFFYNTQTTGAWNGSIDPAALGYGSLHLDIFSDKSVAGYIEFEGTNGVIDHTQPFNLTAGEWTAIDINLRGESKLNNMSVRFTEANMCNILLTNIYFTAAYIEGDETAPVLSDVTASASMTSVELTFSATDDLSEDIYYTITDGTNNYAISGKSGDEVTYTVTGLNPETEYTFTVTAGDGKNISDPKSVTVSTIGFPAAPTPEIAAANVVALYSATYGATAIPRFDNWGSSGTMSTIVDKNGNDVLMFSNYQGQWGGLVDLNLDILTADKLNICIYSDTEGEITIAPVWINATGDTPNKTLTVEAGKWNNYAIALSEFGWPEHGTGVGQLALTNSTLPSFAVDNIFFSADSPLSAIENVNASDNDSPVVVYTLSGIILRNGVMRADALDNLPAGIYIVGGKKVVKR